MWRRPGWAVAALLVLAACSESDPDANAAAAAGRGGAGAEANPPRSQAGSAGGAEAGRGSAGSGASASAGSAGTAFDAAVPRDDASASADAGVPAVDASPDAAPPSHIDFSRLTGVDAVLCDGRPGITFAGVLLPGGLPSPGLPMMAENGYGFFIVEGTCHYYSQHSRLYRTVAGALTEADLQRIREDFQLEQFQELVGDYLGSGFDTSTFQFVLGRGGITSPCMPSGEYGGCIGSGSSVPPAGFAPLRTTLLETLQRLAESGTPVSGDVRYLLMRTDSTSQDIRLWGNPSGWPLGDPEAVALDLAEVNAYQPGMSRLATGDDAAALREVWRKFLAYEVSGRWPDEPPSVSTWIPIQVGTARYELFIRDSLPLEDDKGLIAY